MKREELLKTEIYWLEKLQAEIYNELLDYMEASQINQSDLAEKLGVSKSYVSQLLNGNFDHKLSKLIQLALLMGKVPVINYPKLSRYISQEKAGIKFPFKFYDYYTRQNPLEKSIASTRQVYLNTVFSASIPFHPQVLPTEDEFINDNKLPLLMYGK